MSTPELIPLVEWIDTVRAQLQQAQSRLQTAIESQETPRPTIGLRLEEVTLEAQLVTKDATDKRAGVKILSVVSGDLAALKEVGTTQKIVLKFKPLHLSPGDSD